MSESQDLGQSGDSDPHAAGLLAAAKALAGIPANSDLTPTDGAQRGAAAAVNAYLASVGADVGRLITEHAEARAELERLRDAARRVSEARKNGSSMFQSAELFGTVDRLIAVLNQGGDHA